MLAPCPFVGEKVLGALGKIPSDSFLADSAEVQAKWLHFVASVDADPKSLHDVMFYAIVARTLAEVMGSAQPADYAEPHMRSLIVDGIKVGAAPFVRNLRMLRQHDVMSIAAWLSLSTTIFSSLEDTVDRNVANTDAYTVGVTVHGPEQSLVFRNPQHRRSESLCRL